MSQTEYCPVCDKQIEGSECLVICDVADRMVKSTVLPEGVVWNEEQRKICKACKWHEPCVCGTEDLGMDGYFIMERNIKE